MLAEFAIRSSVRVRCSPFGEMLKSGPQTKLNCEKPYEKTGS